MSEPTGLLSNVQTYSTKDGPGLRTTAFMIGCNLRCKWCANPEAMLPGKKIFYYEGRCHRCGACAAHAANHSITLGEAGCVIDREKCSNLPDMVDLCSYDAYESRGIEMTPAELYKKLARDKVFYDQSGGGVTFSGGEACLQGEFVYETVRLLKREGIHVALDTAGVWDFDRFKDLIAAVDLILYDIKAFDPGLHEQCTGVGNEIILDNAEKLAGMGKEMFIRVVVVPEMNDDWRDMENRMRFIEALGSSVKQIDILKYHRLGLGKYRAMGLDYPLAGIAECSDQLARQAAALAEKIGVKVTIGG